MENLFLMASWGTSPSMPPCPEMFTSLGLGWRCLGWVWRCDGDVHQAGMEMSGLGLELRWRCLGWIWS